jgi:hypothetical protein
VIGAIVLTGLSATFLNNVAGDEWISAEVAQEVSVRVSGGVDFVPTDAVAEAVRNADLDDTTTGALVDAYAAAQLLALKAGLLAALGLAAGALVFTRDLPATLPQPDREPDAMPVVS